MVYLEPYLDRSKSLANVDFYSLSNKDLDKLREDLKKFTNNFEPLFYESQILEGDLRKKMIDRLNELYTHSELDEESLKILAEVGEAASTILENKRMIEEISQNIKGAIECYNEVAESRRKSDLRRLGDNEKEEKKERIYINPFELVN